VTASGGGEKCRYDQERLGGKIAEKRKSLTGSFEESRKNGGSRIVKQKVSRGQPKEKAKEGEHQVNRSESDQKGIKKGRRLRGRPAGVRALGPSTTTRGPLVPFSQTTLRHKELDGTQPPKGGGAKSGGGQLKGSPIESMGAQKKKDGNRPAKEFLKEGKSQLPQLAMQQRVPAPKEKWETGSRRGKLSEKGGGPQQKKRKGSEGQGRPSKEKMNKEK